MNKLIHYISKASLALSMMLLLFIRGNAQDSCATAKLPSNYDPIAAVLDSLVNQNFVQRLNFAAAGRQQQGNFQPLEIPVYSDEVYASRIAKIQSPIPLLFNQQVKEYIDLYAVRKRALTERVMGLSSLYFPLYEEILDKNDLPLEFKYLSIVESALNPMAVSRAGATGLWQFMFQTGKLYNLKVSSYIDERKDPIKATQAACQYFKEMYGIYHDWLLVIAAYNCGAGNVNKAIVRSGGKMTFWEISRYLPKETRGYVPAFIAVTYLMNYTTEHNLTAVPPVISFFEADTVLVDKRVSLRDVSAAIDVPFDLLAYLNPTYKKGIIPDEDESFVLRLPSNKINAYLSNLDKIYSAQNAPSLAEEDALQNPMSYVARTVKVVHVVKRGERLPAIADEFNCTVADLKRWNKIKGKGVYKGQRLAIYTTIHQKIEHHGDVAKNDSLAVKADSTMAAINPADSTGQPVNENKTKRSKKSSSIKNQKIVWHIVQPGDTLWNIAQQYSGVTVEELKSMNKLKTNALKPGTKLKIKISA